MYGIYIGSPDMDMAAVKWDPSLDRDTREHLFNSYIDNSWQQLQEIIAQMLVNLVVKAITDNIRRHVDFSEWFAFHKAHYLLKEQYFHYSHLVCLWKISSMGVWIGILQGSKSLAV